MRLEDEIKQEKGFASQRHKALVNIMFTEGYIRSGISEVLKPHMLTLQQYNVLRILRGSAPDPLSTSDIRSRMLDKMSNASRIVDRLVQKGWVQRRTCASDKRLVDVFITDAGLGLLSTIDGQIEAFNRDLITITEEEAEILNTILDKLRG